VRGPEERRERSMQGQTVVFGASGAGKTTLLAARAARAIGEGRPVIVLDLHGDLGPAILDRLSGPARDRVVAADADERPVAGVAVLSAAPTEVDRAAAHFVAAVKRLSPDGTELAWGFRLERIFDTLARVVLDSGGSLLDLYGLLTDTDRRDAARWSAHRPSTARFLEELGPIVRRDPEFLWSAAARLSKVVLVPALRELLCPADGGLAPEELLRDGRALLVRVPTMSVGPEAAAFAGTMLLARLYLGWAANASASTPRPSALVVLDEAHCFSPRLIGELLSEGRKFGVEVLLATQFPDRLAPEVRAAAAGSSTSVIAFRVPPAIAASVGPWVGLSASGATSVLPSLPVGVGVTFDVERGEVRTIPAVPPGAGPFDRWRTAVERTRAEFEVSAGEAEPTGEREATDRLLLAVLSGEEERTPVRPGEVVAAAARLPGPVIPLDQLELAWRGLREGEEWTVVDQGLRLTPAGERRLGLGAPTGATRETGEHRALLVRAFRIFARRGYRLEIVRQGRFDTTLPDALFRQLGPSGPRLRPWELAITVDRVRPGWAWQYFHGRDVHVEAEVSGAMRPERIGRGYAKAAARDAFVLFLVPDAARARRVRLALERRRVPRDRARVWTLRAALPNPVPQTKP
jgi:hypothetical protein